MASRGTELEEEKRRGSFTKLCVYMISLAN